MISDIYNKLGNLPDKCEITIIPFIQQMNEFSGNIIISDEKFEKINKELSKYKFMITKNHVCIYRNSKFIIENDVVERNTQYLSKILDNNLIIINFVTKLTSDAIPKLAKYHDEYIELCHTYKFGKVTLQIVSINEQKFVKIVFPNIFDKIQNDLLIIDNIFKKI